MPLLKMLNSLPALGCTPELDSYQPCSMPEKAEVSAYDQYIFIPTNVPSDNYVTRCARAMASLKFLNRVAF